MDKFLVFGGCVSRDVFEFHELGKSALADYYARSSFASAFSESALVNIDYDKIKSNFQRRCVERDINSRFKERLLTKNYDYILIDFLSNRFSVAEKNNSVITLSNELMRSGFDPVDQGFEIVSKHTEKYFKLWRAGFSEFAKKC